MIWQSKTGCPSLHPEAVHGGDMAKMEHSSLYGMRDKPVRCPTFTLLPMSFLYIKYAAGCALEQPPCD